jgi:hypothetical protein
MIPYVIHKADGTIVGHGFCAAGELDHQSMPNATVLQVTADQLAAVRATPRAWRVVDGALAAA